MSNIKNDCPRFKKNHKNWRRKNTFDLQSNSPRTSYGVLKVLVWSISITRYWESCTIKHF